jgi:uncharacterized membrane protein YjjP (DUF1212 family)
MSTAQINREYLLCLALALTSFCALYPRTEDDFRAAAKALHVDARFFHGRGHVLCTFRDHHTRTAETYTIKGYGTLELSNLGEVYRIQQSVLEYETSPKDATAQLEKLMSSKNIYETPLARFALIFLLSAVICPLMFDGSFVDMLAAGVGAIILSTPRVIISQTNINVSEYVFLEVA